MREIKNPFRRPPYNVVSIFRFFIDTIVKRYVMCGFFKSKYKKISLCIIRVQLHYFGHFQKVSEIVVN